MNKNLKKIILSFVIVASLVSCKQIQNTFLNDEVLAKVGSNTLILYDVRSIFTPGMSPEDSVKILESYIDMWVKKQLKIAEAEKLLENSQDDIEQMVNDYRNSLLTYKVDQYYVDKKMDTTFTDSIISAYYQANKADFILDKKLIKGVVVTVPTSFRQVSKIRDLIKSESNDSYQDMVDICTKNNFPVHELKTWSNVADIVKFLPASSDASQYDKMLVTGKVTEIKDKDNFIFFKVTSSRDVGEYTPEETLKDVIKRLIFNKRKQEIITSFEDSLYNAAISGKDITIKIK